MTEQSQQVEHEEVMPEPKSIKDIFKSDNKDK